MTKEKEQKPQEPSSQKMLLVRNDYDISQLMCRRRGKPIEVLRGANILPESVVEELRAHPGFKYKMAFNGKISVSDLPETMSDGEIISLLGERKDRTSSRQMAFLQYCLEHAKSDALKARIKERIQFSHELENDNVTDFSVVNKQGRL